MSDLIDREELKKKKVYSTERREHVVPVAEIDWMKPIVVANDATGDNISRQAILDRLNYVIEHGVASKSGKHAISAEVVKEYIEALPPVEQPTAYWKDGGKNRDGTYNIYCSNCGAGFKTRGHARSISTAKKYKVCPTCTARMIGDKEGEK